VKISNKGLYALEAMINLAERYREQPVKIHQIATSERIPEKFLELILLDLKAARLVESLRGANGGYRLRRSPAKIFLGEIIRTIDGPLAPLGDAQSLRQLVKRDKKHSALYQIFLNVRNAAAGILDHTSLADLCRTPRRAHS
jgi:Rrf2 family transcriptional regulator, cysteine metabolism repressor